MSFEVLCTPYFPADEVSAIEQAAHDLNLTPESLIREAVKFFVGQCAPTQGGEANTPDDHLN